MKVDVLVPKYRAFTVDAYNAIHNMCAYTKREGVDLEVPALEGTCYVHMARNRAMEKARKDADFVLFCDDDMLPPADSLSKLLKHNLPAVSALTTTRRIPVKHHVTIWNEERDAFFPIKPEVINGQVLMGKLGLATAFLLLRRDAIEEARRDHLEAYDWLAANEESLRRMGVPAKKRDRERRRIAELRAASGEEPWIFDFDIGKGMNHFGEDNAFCRRLFRLGFDTAVDSSVWVGHIGDFPYGPWNVGQESAQEVTC